MSRECVDVGCAYLAAKAAYIGEAQVIGDNDKEVGTLVGRLRLSGHGEGGEDAVGWLAASAVIAVASGYRYRSDVRPNVR